MPDRAGEREHRRVRSLHRQMSAAEFAQLPRQLGWQYDYNGIWARATPAFVFVPFCLEMQPQPLRTCNGVRGVTSDDAGALVEPFLDAFAAAPEFANQTSTEFNRSATQYLRGFFGTVHGVWSPVSVLVERAGEVVAAALVKRLRKGHLLDCIYVAPDHARQGLATALAARVVNGLVAAGEGKLYSRVLVGNAPSVAWHEKFGFRELSDPWVAQHRHSYFYLQYRLARESPQPDPKRMAYFQEQAAFWFEEVIRLRGAPVQENPAD
jgi:L-amino acid N-acyltransferase YncA